MLTNADVTLFIKTARNGAEAWERRVIIGVSWASKMDTAIVNGAMIKARTLTLRIPIDADFDGAQYVPPRAWSGAVDTWTLRGGDIAVRGIVDTPEGGMRALAVSCTEMLTVTAVSDNRRGGLPHWLVSGR